MNNPPRNTPRDEPTPHESSDRPAPWVLDLGLEVASGRRPWLQPLAGAALLFGTPFLIKMIGGADLAAAEKAPELAAFIDQLTGFVTAFSWVLAGISLVLGVGYWFICRHAYAAWCSLPEEEREELARQRVEALSRALARLGGIDPAGLPITSEDLEQLGDRHRLLLEDLRVRSSQTATQICAGARARTDDLVMAGRLHRALSKDTIVRPPHAASSATDPRVLALVELDTEIQAEAAAIGESLDTGHCNCNQDTHERLIRAGARRAFAENLDDEARSIGATCGGVRVWSLYVPNGRTLDDPHMAYKLQWLARLRDRAVEWAADGTPVALCGDWNVAPQDEDVWSMEYFADKTHVSPPERAAFNAFLESGFVDVVRPYAPGPGTYTYWDYQQLAFPKRRGMRIDFVLGSASFAERVSGAAIDREERKGKGASDHAPVIVGLDGDDGAAVDKPVEGSPAR